MSRRTIGKITAAVLLGILLGCYIHHDYVTWGRRGRDAFLAHETHRFELSMAEPGPIGVTVLGATIVVLSFLGAYELIALGVSAALSSTKSNQASK